MAGFTRGRKLTSAVTEVDVLEAYLDKAVLALNSGELTAVDAAKAKLWATGSAHQRRDHGQAGG